MKIAVLNGPNLNLQGKRQTNVYGTETLQEVYARLENKYPFIEFVFYQSNHEGDLIDKLHEIGFDHDGIVLNAGAYSHTSIALADAIAAITAPVVEIHISNIFAREPFRHRSAIAANCVGSVCGLGLKGYELAVEYFVLSRQK